MLAFSLELISTILTLICVVLCRLQKKSGWLYGLFGAALLIPLFYINEIWGQFILSFIFVIMGVIGVNKWGESNNIKYKKPLHLLITFFSLLIGNIILIIFDYNLVIVDYLIVGLSLIANTLLIYKVTESWILWIWVNLLSIFLFVSSELYMLTFIYVIFLINSIMAFIEWRNKINK